MYHKNKKRANNLNIYLFIHVYTKSGLKKWNE